MINQKKINEIFKLNKNNPKLIGKQEGYTLEFKENYSWGSMPQYAKAMVSMANNKGGYIVFGIKDKPRELVGMNEKSISKFNERDLAEWSKYLRDYFEPTIEFKKEIITFKGKEFGVIEIAEASIKPIICKKYVDGKLRQGAIYYRYKAENTDIQYAELKAIIDHEINKINNLWIEKVKQISVAGVAHSMVLNTNSGNLYGNNCNLFISRELVEKIRFVDKGSFIENGGEPVLSIVGEVEQTKDTPISMVVGEREIALTSNRIIEAFLNQEKIADSTEYIKFIVSSPSKHLPIFFYYSKLVDKEINDFVGMPKTIDHIKNRIGGHITYKEVLKQTESNAFKRKITMRNLLVNNVNLVYDIDESDLKYAIMAFRTIDEKIIKGKKKAYLNWLKTIFENKYHNMDQSSASEFRKSVCYLDEIILKDKKS